MNLDNIDFLSEQTQIEEAFENNNEPELALKVE
jgi:hypothetical protein